MRTKLILEGYTIRESVSIETKRQQLYLEGKPVGEESEAKLINIHVSVSNEIYSINQKKMLTMEEVKLASFNIVDLTLEEMYKNIYSRLF